MQDSALLRQHEGKGMLEGIKRAHRLSAMGGKWIQVTSLDPGDRGQIVRAASRHMADGTSPENAWLTALLGWIRNMPWPEQRKVMGHALQLFLDRYEHESLFDDELIWAARRVAEEA